MALAVLLLLGVFGLALLVWGWRGRRLDDHPVCRKCRFDLTGVYPQREVCPECGWGLTGPSSVRTGNRRKRRGLLTSGAVITLLMAVLLGGYGWHATSETNLNSYKPTWLLLLELDYGRHDTIKAAMVELDSRHAAGPLTDIEMTRITDRLLDIQGDLIAVWEPEWGDFIEAIHVAGDLDDERWQRYVDQMCELEVEVRPLIRAGDPIPVRFSAKYVRAGSTTVYLMGDVTALRIGDKEIVLNERQALSGMQICLWTGSGGPYGYSPEHLIDPFPRGYPLYSPDEPFTPIPQEKLVIPEGETSLLFDIQWITDSWLGGTTKYNRTDRFSATTEIVDPATQTVELFVDDATRKLMSDKLPSISIEKGDDIVGLHYDDGGFMSSINLSIPVIARQILTDGTREWEFGHFGYRPSEGQSYLGGTSALSEAELPERVDVILRPAPDLARETVDVFKIWGEEIIIKDVPIKTKRRDERDLPLGLPEIDGRELVPIHEDADAQPESVS